MQKQGGEPQASAYSLFSSLEVIHTLLLHHLREMGGSKVWNLRYLSLYNKLLGCFFEWQHS